MALDPENKILLDSFDCEAEKCRAVGAPPRREEEEGAGEIPVSRWDHEMIKRLVTPNASVLDLGCGSGTLLSCLMTSQAARVQGLEIDPDLAARCVERGVPVIQANLDQDILSFFPDASFDFVIVEKTLQTIKDPVHVLKQMLRIGRVGIVSFPNFGHWRVRQEIMREGKAPVSRALPYEWYNTPNIRVLTIRDFEDFCAANRVRVLERHVFAEGHFHPMRTRDNLLAEEALYVLCRPDERT